MCAAGAVSLAIGIASLDTSRLHAQATAAAVDPSLAFEVASVKPNKSGDGRMMIGGPPGGRFTMTNVPLRQIILLAYQIQAFQLVGGPGWVGNDRFDVVAKAPENTPPIGIAGGSSPGPMQFMLRNLLADRFKLKVHNESREMPIYALVPARSDGKLGPKMQPATVDCSAMRGRRGGGPAGGPPPVPAPGERIPCGMMMGIGNIAAGGVTMAQLASSLSARVGRVVVDRTGLTGFFEFNLDFTPDQLPQGAAPPPGAPTIVNGAPIDPNGPSIYTAIQEQLGLKLDSQRGPVDVVVIDSVEQPTED
jgi:uncharacterized protein (TIGR03435 family)